MQGAGWEDVAAEVEEQLRVGARAGAGCEVGGVAGEQGFWEEEDGEEEGEGAGEGTETVVPLPACCLA